MTEGLGWGLATAAVIADETLDTVIEFARAESPHQGAHPDLPTNIERAASNLLRGKPVGK